MKLREIGEFGLIDQIKEDALFDPEQVVQGIGDDAAILRPPAGRLQLFTTDMLVENVHFQLQATTAWQLGYKALAVNISDIAAMGGVPRHAVVSVAIPPQTEAEFIFDFYQGMKELCREFKVNIVGGDTVSSPGGLVINVALIGDVEPKHAVRRDGARPGDLVVVTGTLGDSAGGLQLLLNGEWEKYDFAGPLLRAHLTPHPQVQAGGMLAAAGVSSMNDISDGLASEINEIAAASGAGARIYADKVPISPELQECALALGRPALELALFGGEDFQLVFTVDPQKLEELQGRLPVKTTVVGEIVERERGVTMINALGRSLPLEAKGYNHFR